VAGMEMPASNTPRSVFDHRPIMRPCDDELAQLADMVNSARKVALFCGFGCARAHDQVIALAEKIKAPVGVAYRGKWYVAYDNPFDVGMNGLLGYGAAYEAVHECDLLLLLGTDFPYDHFLPTKSKIAQVDMRVDHLGRRSRLDLGLWGDVGETIKALLPLVQPKEDRSFLDAMLSRHRAAVEKLNVYVDHVGKRRPMHPQLVVAALNEIAASDAIFTADTGMCNVWSARYLTPTKDRRLLASFSHGSMANALPQAIGAQLCFPNRQVIAMAGDGGLAMLMGELLTVVQYNLPIKIVVFDNGALGMVKLEMEIDGLPDWQTDLRNPDFAKVAEAMGIKGIRIENPADLHSGIKQALDHDGPVLVDAITDPNALSLSPNITEEQMTGFALSMGKLVLSGHVDEVLATVEANLTEV